MIVIGIDPGVKTGYAIYDAQKRELKQYGSGSIFNVFKIVGEHWEEYGANITVIVEDARLCKYAGPNGNAARMGVGSVKRDSQIWVEYLKLLGASFKQVDPRHNKLKKLSAKDLTKFIGHDVSGSNQHARDAISLAWLHANQYRRG
jgi:hypothetical protein